MQQITIVTGNKGKFLELESMARGKLDFAMKDLDIDEIQSLNLEEIIEHKVKQAYALLNTPVIVDDVAAALKQLNGLPGPFIKYFNQRLGVDALYQLAKDGDTAVTITCLAAYYDGVNMIVGTGEVHGHVVPPRGDNGFGFDVCVVPEGQERTMAEMSPEEKTQVSHRGKAFRNLLAKLESGSI
jgi:inosine triphosphate pyrophosphatase